MRHADLFALYRGYTPYNISANRTQQLQFLANISINIFSLANTLASAGHKTLVIATLPALYLTPHARIEPPYGVFLPPNEAIVDADIRAAVKSLRKAHPKAKVLLWDLERLYKRVGEWLLQAYRHDLHQQYSAAGQQYTVSAVQQHTAQGDTLGSQRRCMYVLQHLTRLLERSIRLLDL